MHGRGVQLHTGDKSQLSQTSQVLKSEAWAPAVETSLRPSQELEQQSTGEFYCKDFEVYRFSS